MDNQDSQARQGNNDSNINNFNDTGAWIFVWIVALVVFLLVPICATSYRRKMCLLRIKQRRWNVTVDDETDGSSRSQPPQTNQIHPVGNTQTKLSKQEEEDIRQIFLLGYLSRYSMCLNRTDIKQRSKNQGVESLTVIQQDEPAEMPTESDIETADDESKIQHQSNNDSHRLIESSFALSAPISGTFEDMESVVVVPLSGVDCQTFSTSDGQTTREVPNGCSICFSEYAAGDRVVWASNPACAHVFHEDCALHWFMAVGKKDLRRRRRAGGEELDNSMDPVQHITDFPITCPCCRQTFFSADNNNNKEESNESNLECLPRCRTSSNADSHPSTTEEEEHPVVGDENV